MKSKRYHCATLASLAALALAAPAWASIPISLTNFGFENPVLAEGVYPTTIPNWNQGKYDVSAPAVWIVGASGAGNYNLSTSEYTTPSAPEGDNMAYTTTTVGFDAGISQVLTTTLQAEVQYDLNVKVGNPFVTNGGATADYRIELLAGGVLLQSATGTSPADDTSFTTATLSFTTDAAPAQLGQALQIRLVAKDFAADLKVDFDDVQLTATYAHPVANPGGPYTVAIPAGSLALNGSASLPSDGSSLSQYEWDLNNDGTYDLTEATPTPATIPYLDLTTTYGMIAGSNTIKLRVTDATTSETATATTTVTLAIPSTIFNGTTNTDWNTATNWSSGLPTGSIDVAIAAAKTANNASATPATSTGKLTLNSGSVITVPHNAAVGENNVVTTPSSIEFNGGTLDLSSQDTISFPALTMTGTGKLTASSSNGDSRTRNINNAISGSGQFTIEGRNRQVWNIGANNSSFSGNLILPAIDRYEVKLNVSGSAGTGNVTVTPRTSDARSAVLVLGANNVFADTATLTLSGKGWNNSTGGTYPSSVTALDMKTFNDTVDKLFVLGVQQAAGVYTGGGAFNWIKGSGILTVTTGPPDTTPPTLAGSGFVDNKSGGPITAFETVSYTVTFSEPMKSSTVGTDDFENAGSPAATINSVTPTGDPKIFTVSVTPGGTGTLQLQVKAGAVLEDLVGNPLSTTTAIPDDTSIMVNPDPLPALVSINDNVAGGPVLQDQAFTYFVTFSQVMDPGTLDAADFENGTGPAITVTQVIATGNPAIFAVDVTPGGTGTITLQIKAGAVIANANGTALDTTAALADDIAIPVNAGSVPVRGTITIDGSASWTANSGTLSGTLDASGSDKLVVIVTGETGNPGDLSGNCSGVTYDGVALTQAVDRVPIGGNPFDQTFNDIWYLDNPATATGAIIASVNSRGSVTAFALSGTAPGVGFTAISPQASKSVVLSTSFANSMVIASHGMGGDGNTADVGNVNALLPLIERSATGQASLWDGHVTASALVPTVGTASYSFTGGSLIGSHTIAAEFLAAEASAGTTYATWIAGFPVGLLTGFTDDADHDGVKNGVENFFGTNPSVFGGGVVPGAVSGNTFTFTHPQNATPASDITAAYQWSKDLATFNASGATDGDLTTVTITTQLDTPVVGTTTVTATVTGTATSKLFVNVAVTQN